MKLPQNWTWANGEARTWIYEYHEKTEQINTTQIKKQDFNRLRSGKQGCLEQTRGEKDKKKRQKKK